MNTHLLRVKTQQGDGVLLNFQQSIDKVEVSYTVSFG